MQNAGAPLPSRRCSRGASRGNTHDVPAARPPGLRSSRRDP